MNDWRRMEKCSVPVGLLTITVAKRKPPTHKKLYRFSGIIRLDKVSNKNY